LANIKSALKQWHASLRRRARNRTINTAVKTYVSRAVGVIAAGGSAEASTAAVRQAFTALDKAANKGFLHANNASRRKSRLMTRLNTALRAAPPDTAPVVEPVAVKPAVKPRARRTTAQSRSTAP